MDTLNPADNKPATEPTKDYFSMKSESYGGALPDASVDYLAEIAKRYEDISPREIAARVESLVAGYESWRRTSLNLMAAENTMSRRARRLLDSDLATRVTEGFPGAKDFPPGKHNVHIDEIEGLFIALAKRLFRAQYVEWRATSTTMANAVAFWSMTEPGDTILVQSMEGGGNMNYHRVAIPHLRQLKVEMLPHSSDFTIDADQAARTARAVRPKLIVIGGSQVLFPYPLKELRQIADEVGARILFDAAHLGALIAAGEFQDPLAEGVDVLSMGTQKINGGPVGGLAFTNDLGLARRMLALTFPAFIQTRDLNKYASAAFALAEMTAHGSAYARQVVRNARALGHALEGCGFRVIGSDRGYTNTHLLFLDVRDFGAPRFEALCQRANILIHKSHMSGDSKRGVRTGIRISVQEATRQGMNEDSMTSVAELIQRVTVGGEPAERVGADVAKFVSDFPTVKFSFDDEDQA